MGMGGLGVDWRTFWSKEYFGFKKPCAKLPRTKKNTCEGATSASLTPCLSI